MFKKAGQPELIRSNQKDVFYVTYLRENAGQIFRDFAGLQNRKVLFSNPAGTFIDGAVIFSGVYSWIKWKDELELLAEICYFGLTTISGNISDSCSSIVYLVLLTLLMQNNLITL